MEILIALAIFTFGALSILALFHAAMVAHRSAIDRSVAAMVAQNVVAQHRLLFDAATRPEIWSNIVEQDDTNYPDFRYTLFFEPISDSRNLANPTLFDTYVMVVDVYWGPRKRPRHERFRTVILRRGNLDQ